MLIEGDDVKYNDLFKLLERNDIEVANKTNAIWVIALMENYTIQIKHELSCSYKIIITKANKEFKAWSLETIEMRFWFEYEETEKKIGRLEYKYYKRTVNGENEDEGISKTSNFSMALDKALEKIGDM